MATYGQPDRKLVIDINAYLIDKHPMLTLRDRNAIGAFILKDKLDLKSIYKQIDRHVKTYETDADE